MFSLFNNFNDAGILNSLINTFTKPNFSDIIKEPTNVDLDEIDNSDGIFLNKTITDEFVNNIIQSLYEKLNDKLDKSNNYPYTILPYKDGYSIIQIPYYENGTDQGFYGFNKYINIFILNPYFVLFNTSFQNWIKNKVKIEKIFPNEFFGNLPTDITINPQKYQLVLSFYDPNDIGQLIYSDFNFPYKIVNGIKKYYYCFYQLVDPNVNSGSTINYNLEIFPGQSTFNLDQSDLNTDPKTFTSSILSETQGSIPTATYSYLKFAESFITDSDSIPKFVFTIQNCFNFKNTTPGYTSRGFVPYNSTVQDFSQCQFIPYTNGIGQLDTLIQSGNVDFPNITLNDINYYINGQTPLITNNGNYSITHTNRIAQKLGSDVFTNLTTQNAAKDTRTIKFGVNPNVKDENLYATTGSTYTSFSNIADSINNANIAAGTYGLNGICLDSSNCIKTSGNSSISDDHNELYKYINTNFNGTGENFLNTDYSIADNTYLITPPSGTKKIPNVDWTDPNNPLTYQYVDRTSTTNQFNTASEWEQRTTNNNPFIYDSSFITVLNNDNPTSGKPFGWNYCTQTDNNTDPNNTGIKIPDKSTPDFNTGITTSQDLAANQLWECGNCFNILDQFGPCNRPESANSYWYYNSGELEGTPSGPTEDFKLMRTNMKIVDKKWKYIDGADLATNFTYKGILPLVSNRTDSYSCTNWKSCPNPPNCPDQGNPYNIMTILNGTGSDQVSGQTVYGCLLNYTNLKSGSNFPDYSGRCDSTDPDCAITAGIGIYPVSTKQSLWDGQKKNKPSSYDETTLGFGFNIKLDTGISYSELVNSFGINNTQPLTTCNIYNLSPIIGPLSDKYICNPNGSGTQGTWNSGGQGPDSWCFNIGSPYIQNYTTDGNGKLSPSSTFYFKVQTNGIYYNIINDPSITFGFDQPVTSSPFLWNGAPYQQSSQCLYDIYNNVISDNTMSFNVNALNQPPSNIFKIYGILSNATGITAPCNSAINYKTDGTPDNPHELRINFNGALGVANKQNDYFLIDQAGLSQGYVTYFINQNCVK